MSSRAGKNGTNGSHAKGVSRRVQGRSADAQSNKPEARFFNRDLSWLEFNRRVLEQAADERIPLLERVRFLVIFSGNLDEFFMKRVALVRRWVNAGQGVMSHDGLTAREHLAAIRELVQELQAIQAEIYAKQIVPELAAAGVVSVKYAELSKGEQNWVDEWYKVNVFPALTPLAVDPSHRFPFISNLSDNLAIIAQEKGSHDTRFARVKIPQGVKRHVEVPSQGSGPRRFIELTEIVRNNLDDIFPGVVIKEQLHFRVTRSSGLQRDDKLTQPATPDVLRNIEDELKQRKFARAIRLECEPDPSDVLLRQLVDKLNMDPTDVYERGGMIDWAGLAEFADLDLAGKKWPRWRPVAPARLASSGRDIFGCIRKQDILLHHPYESFSASVERFIAEAAADPDVLTIKQTLYRTSPDSPFVESLIRAAESGKQVACLVEVRARFDEQRNVKFVKQLQRAGVHVAYGVMGLKTHSKTSLVVRKEKHGLRCYAHIGTGNYHPKTAQLYTDLGLLTCDPAITGDLVNLFNYLTGLGVTQSYEHLLIAPFNMRDRFNAMIEREIDIATRKREAIEKGESGAEALPDGRIMAKINSMEDLKITERLYKASQAGVKIDLVVRGFCCLRPGVPGMSENIRVRSVVGRFLEHSRIFYFGAGQVDPVDGDWLMGSADWMYRNLNDRVECIVPVRDPIARGRLLEIFDIMLCDRRSAWDLQTDGSYVRAIPAEKDSAESLARQGTFETLMRITTGARQSGHSLGQEIGR